MPDTVRRFASVIALRPEHEQEYLALHRTVWPDVEAAIRAAHIRAYSIFLRDGVLFSYFEYTGDDHEADMAALSADPAMRRWLELTDPCQRPLASAAPGERWVDAVEVYRLGPS